ncbi:Terminase small subunit (gp1) [Escherichia coli]|uniref:Terminase small subunit (Gp1) n=1 Tax=Escherichia coli TaxID=562 RepID=A0A3S4NTX7_ECOLX|nr:Terminase small subunit (gp1) [Escherichia coli]
MNVNKKKLADIFGVDVRTITAWQSQGLPLVSGGGKGTESVLIQLLPFSGMRRGS